MDVKPKILFSQVMHKRLFPHVNRFVYDIYYLCFPLSKMEDMKDGYRFGVNSRGLMSFYEKDHGARDGSSLQIWIKEIFSTYGVKDCENIFLVTMPRVFGHVFNPVSFWLCQDSEENLRAVLCEVNNTFGETHSYLCAPDNGDIITPEMVLEGKKLFHVSPFLEREGKYRFRFVFAENKAGFWIDYYDVDGQKQLVTSLTGQLAPMTRKTRRTAFWRYSLVSLLVVLRIHWQAFRLWFSGVRYIPKPLQNEQKISSARYVTKM